MTGIVLRAITKDELHKALECNGRRWLSRWYGSLRLSAIGDYRALGAFRGARLVGFIRWHTYDRAFCFAGTWVAPDERGCGLAVQMWRHVLGRQTKTRKIIVYVATDGGTSLVERLRKIYKSRTWEVHVA